MRMTLKDWRPGLGLACAVAMLAAHGAPAAPPAPAGGNGAAVENTEVDPALKKLAAANGLFQRGLYKFAADEYKTFLEQYPKHEQATAARYAMAVCAYRQQDFAGAIEPMQQVLADPKFEQRDEALTVLGYCQLATKKYDEAAKAFGDLLSNYPQSKRAETAGVYRLQSLYLGGKTKDVIPAAADFIQKYPKSTELPSALYFKGLAERAEGQNEAAAVTLQKLNADFPDSKYKLDAMLLLGQALEAQGKLAPAIEQYRAMAAAAPQSRAADAHYSLGLALYKTGAYPEAIKELRTIVDSYPMSSYLPAARLQLGLAQLGAQKIPDARTTLSAVAKDDPEHAADARYGIAQCDMSEKKFDSAHDVLDALAKLQPAPSNLSQILLDRAICLIGLEKFADASTELEQFESRFADSPQIAEALYRHAYCLHRLQKYEQSLAICQKISAIPKSAMAGPAAELAAENLFLMAKYPEAEHAFAAIITNAPADDTRLPRFELRVGQCEYFAGNYAKAVDVLRPLVDQKSKGDEAQQAQFLLGDALLQQGGHDAEAADALSKFLALAKPPQFEARYKQALALSQGGDADAAIKALSPLIAGPSDDAWVQRGLLQAGQLQYKAKKPDDASESLKKLVAAKPPADLLASATYLLGWIDFDAKRFDDAALKWKTVADGQGNPKLAADAAFQCAVALKEAGKIDDALASAQAFAASHREKPDADRAAQLISSTLYSQAWALRGKKDDAAAQECYRKLLSLQPDGKLAPAARTELADLLYNEKKYPDAVTLLEAVTTDKSAEAKVCAYATYKLAWCYQKLEKPQKAEALFASYAGLSTDDPEYTPSALLEAASAASAQGKFDQVEKYLADLLKRFPNYSQNAVALLKLGEAQAEQQEFEAALKSDQQFLQDNPKSEFAYRAEFGRGWALENLKKYDDARAAYKRVIAASNGEYAARAQFQIGETLLAEQKYEAAVKEFLAVDDVYAYPKWSARALFEAGRAFEQMKQPEQAKRQYTQVVEKYKDAPEAELARQRLQAL